MSNNTFTTGSLAARAGVNPETIRFYEKHGLLPRADRTSGGYRVLQEPALQQLIFIRRAKALGFSLQEIGELLALSNGSLANCREVRRVAERRLAMVERQLADLGRLRASLKRIVGQCYKGRRPARCPIIEQLNRASGE